MSKCGSAWRPVPRVFRALCRYVIQEIIKDMARNRSVEAKRKVKVLVLHEVDGLTKDAQHSLRRTMEKYSNSCRLVMLCNTVSKVCISVLCCVITVLHNSGVLTQ